MGGNFGEHAFFNDGRVQHREQISFTQYSRGAGMMAVPPDERPDRVTGYRLGPPDPGICFRAGRREAEGSKTRRDSAK